MKIIITRPVEDALPLAGKLKALGHEDVIAPLLKIVARVNVVVPQRNYQAICLTSANGIRSIENIKALKAVPVLAVGPQSYQAAIDRGFLNVQAQGGDVAGLAAYVCATLRSSDGPLLYISGSTTSGDLEGKLRDAGFDVDRVMTYDAVPADLVGFENEILTSDAVLLYSPRSANLWAVAISNLQLQDKACTLQHICLSLAIADKLPASWPKRIAVSPNEAALIAALDC